MKFTRIVIAASLATALGAEAQTTPAASTDAASHPPAAAAAPASASASASASAPQSDGEVRKVDMAQGKVTLRHGPLENLGMPAMTMVFKVADSKLLDGLKEGDKVKFTAEKVNGAIAVTNLRVMK